MDAERNLFYGTREELEAEANWTAAQLLFQGPRFHERALSDQVSIRTPIALAEEYAASMHASIRYYVQHRSGRRLDCRPLYAVRQNPSDLEQLRVALVPSAVRSVRKPHSPGRTPSRR